MKTNKMKTIKEKKGVKIFLLNGGITILEMKPIVGKRHAFRVKYEAEFSVGRKEHYSYFNNFEKNVSKNLGSKPAAN